jgi:hypothetical protein
VSTTAFRAIVVWLLLLVTWGVFRALTALGDEFIVVHLIRDIAGLSLWILPLAAVVAWVGEQIKPNRPDEI